MSPILKQPQYTFHRGHGGDKKIEDKIRKNNSNRYIIHNNNIIMSPLSPLSPPYYKQIYIIFLYIPLFSPGTPGTWGQKWILLSKRAFF